MSSYLTDDDGTIYEQTKPGGPFIATSRTGAASTTPQDTGEPKVTYMFGFNLDLPFKKGVTTSIHHDTKTAVTLYGGYTQEEIVHEIVKSELLRLKAMLPEKLHYDRENVPKYLRPQKGESWEPALRHEDGFNLCLIEVKEIIDRMIEEMK